MQPESWLLDGDMCRVCDKPLRDEIGPTVTDRAGHRYHFPCWRRRVNIATAATRDAISKGRRKPAHADPDLPRAARESA